MLAYIVRRLLLLPLMMLGVTFLIFALLQLLGPERRVALYVTDPSQLKTPGQIPKLIEKYGLNDPFPLQYWRWLKEVLQGNLGWSETARMTVLNALKDRLPATAELALFALPPIILIGIWLGVISAVYHDRPLDHLTRVMAITGWSFPTFVFGLLVLMIFYGRLEWFPPGRLSLWAEQMVYSKEFIRYTGMNTIDALLNRNLSIFLDALKHIILPVITLSYLSWALLLRVTRSSMLETLRQDYIMTARAKGLAEKNVIHKHARRNALIPVATISGFLVIGLLSGVVITETIFNYKGLGQWAAGAALRLDVPAVLGFALFSTFIIVVGNLIVDLFYAYIDPRVRLE